MKRKGFTLIEVMIAISLSVLLFGMVYSSIALMKNWLARKEGQTQADTFINSVNSQFVRTFSTANTVTSNVGNNDPMIFQNAGYIINNQPKIGYTFQRGFTSVGPFSGDIYNSAHDGNILILMVCTFENPFLNRANPGIDLYRALGISNISGSNIYSITSKSNLVYIEHPASGGTDIVRKLSSKSKKLFIRLINIQWKSDRVINISIGVRDYLHKAKRYEDLRSRCDPYNYGTTKIISLHLRAR